MSWTGVVILATLGVVGVVVAYFLGGLAERKADAGSKAVTSVVAGGYV